jgi:competence protein ComEA
MLVLATGTLLAVQATGYLRVGTRPTELERTYRVNVNEASEAELMQLPGVGPALAKRIVEYRKTRGKFQRVDDLRQVRGIGQALMERLRPFIAVGPEDPEEDEPEAVPRPARKPAAPMPAGNRDAALKGVRINVNAASLEELRLLPGIGPKKGQRIIDERRRRPFASADDLRRVQGIGPKTLARLRPYVIVSGPAVTRKKSP